MVSKDEAIHKALKVLNCLNNNRVYETAWVKGAINACEEALEQPAEPRLVSYALDGSTCTLNIDGEEVYFNREQPAKEPVAWMKSALDNARDVCKYLDHDMVKEAKAHTQFFWGDIDKIKEAKEALEQPAQEPYCWTVEQKNGLAQGSMCRTIEECKSNPLFDAEIDHIIPLYTHPHQVVPTSTWQGLTDDVIASIWMQEAAPMNGQDFKKVYRAIEQALKEKNHG